MADYYVSVNQQPAGPWSEHDIRDKIVRGEIRPTDLCWAEGMAGWVPLQNMLQLTGPDGRILSGVETRQYAGFWIRTGAAILDFFVMGLASIPLNIVMQLLMPEPPAGLQAKIHNGQGDAEAMQYVLKLLPILLGLMLISLLINWLYHALMESSSRQATLGKMACGLKVKDGQGNRISFGRATGRFFAKNFISHGLTMGIGIMLCGWTKRKQCLHDMMCDTIVVHEQQADASKRQFNPK